MKCALLTDCVVSSGVRCGADDGAAEGERGVVDRVGAAGVARARHAADEGGGDGATARALSAGLHPTSRHQLHCCHLTCYSRSRHHQLARAGVAFHAALYELASVAYHGFTETDVSRRKL